MASVPVTVEDNPLKKFDAPVLKAMGSTVTDAGAPRAMFLPSNMGEAMELAKLMAAGNFVPPHLRGRPGDCLAVVMQASRWAMDPFAVGNKTYFVNDRIAYEAQLVNAVINSAGVLDGRLHPEWSGEGNDLTCAVTGKLNDDPGPKTRRVAIKNITTRNSPLWKQDPEQQLAYYASRAWVRLYAPEVLLGVYTPDEVVQMGPVDAEDLTPEPLSSAMLLEQAKEPTPANDEAVDPATGEVVATVDQPAPVEEPPAWAGKRDELVARLDAAKTPAEVKAADEELQRHLVGFPDEVQQRLTASVATAMRRVRKVAAVQGEG